MKKGQILQSILIFAALTTLLFLFSYLSYWEVKRNYPELRLLRLACYTEPVLRAIEKSMASGIPLGKILGQKNLLTPVLSRDPDIESIRMVDSWDNPLLIGVRSDLSEDREEGRKYKLFSGFPKSRRFRAEVSDSTYRIIASLENRSETFGRLVIVTAGKGIQNKIERWYGPVFRFLGFLSLFLPLSAIILKSWLRQRLNRKKMVIAAYAAGFSLVAAVNGYAIFFLYYPIIAGFSPGVVAAVHNENVDKVFDMETPYALSDRGFSTRIASPHISADEAGTPQKNPDSADSMGAQPPEPSRLREAAHTVSPPPEFPAAAVNGDLRARITDHFIIFGACGLLCYILLGACTGTISLTHLMMIKSLDPACSLRLRIGLDLVKPAYFLAVCIFSLSCSFLPQLASSMAVSSNFTHASASFPFTVYYVFFAASLLPSGQYSNRGSLKKLMGFGFIIDALGLFLISLTENYWVFTLGRSLSGIGQGSLLIGLQAYLLSITPVHKMTQGLAVKVIGRNSGLIVGTTIGAILYSHLDYSFLFRIASALSLCGAGYLWWCVPSRKFLTGQCMPGAGAPPFRERRKRGRIFRDIFFFIRDREFVKTLFLVGLVAKIGVTGVVMFGVPLVLSRENFTTRYIGQALILYYISTMIMTHFAARLVDRIGRTRPILIAGATLSGLGMLIFGFIGGQGPAHFFTHFQLSAHLSEGMRFYRAMGGPEIADISYFIVMACILLAGISNGLLAAPTLTHINKTDAALRYGKNSITAAYLFLERIGHATGPMVINRLFILTDESSLAISIFGIATVIFGGIFLLTARR